MVKGYLWKIVLLAQIQLAGTKANAVTSFVESIIRW